MCFFRGCSMILVRTIMDIELQIFVVQYYACLLVLTEFDDKKKVSFLDDVLKIFLPNSMGMAYFVASFPGWIMAKFNDFSGALDVLEGADRICGYIPTVTGITCYCNLLNKVPICIFLYKNGYFIRRITVVWNTGHW